MSQPCAAPKCDRVSRVLCDCCKQNFCVLHFNEHNASLVSQLNPLTDQINELGDRLNRLDIHQALGDCRKQLEEWRLDCHQQIDHFFEQKSQELDHLVVQKIDKKREEILSVQTKLDKLLRDQEASRQDIDRLTTTIRHLETEMNKIEQAHLLVNTRPLLIDDNIVQFKDIGVTEFDASTLSSVHRTIVYSEGSRRSVASNDRLLLMHQAPNLCFVDVGITIVRQVLWPHDIINDMCWSSMLDRFIVIVKDNIYLVDEGTLSIESVKTVEKQNWRACTCSNDVLFLSTKGWGPSIMEARLSPSITIIKEWKSPTTCTSEEGIDDMIYSNGKLATVISNKVEKPIRMELRCCKTLAHLWSLFLDATYQTIALRCCSLDHNEWFVIDHATNRLLHISADGKMKQTIAYKSKPYRATLFGTNILAVSTETDLNFHRI